MDGLRVVAVAAAVDERLGGVGPVAAAAAVIGAFKAGMGAAMSAAFEEGC